MSKDILLAQSLRGVFEHRGRAVVRTDTETELRRTLRANHPAAVLLDLDLPAGAAWEIADQLSRDANGPPVVLLTARTGQFDFKVAVSAGSIVDKTTDPAQLLDMVDQLVEAPHPVQEKRRAIQRVVVLWLKPLISPIPASAYRDFGINE